MLPRVLEPDVMDTAQEAADYDAMDHTEVNRRFVDDLLAAIGSTSFSLRSLSANGPPLILDLGTGTARIPIELCQRVPNLKIVAVDAAEHMLHFARRNVDTAGMAHRIVLRRDDAKQLPFVDGSFGCAISNSIVHHIPEPIHCLAEAVRVAAAGGLLFFRDLFRPGNEAELNALVNQYAPAAGISAAADRQRAMFAASLHAALTMEEIRKLVAQLGFSGETVRATSDRHWTWSARKSP